MFYNLLVHSSEARTKEPFSFMTHNHSVSCPGSLFSDEVALHLLFLLLDRGMFCVIQPSYWSHLVSSTVHLWASKEADREVDFFLTRENLQWQEEIGSSAADKREGCGKHEKQIHSGTNTKGQRESFRWI